MTALTFPDTTIHRVFDSLLAKGLCHGNGAAHELGDYCILQALQLAERGLTPSKGIRDITDTATCVADRPRKLAIRLNDRAWSSNEARALGLRALGHALIGSAGIDEEAWANAVGGRYIATALPDLLIALSKLKYYAPDAEALLAAASRCQEEKSRDAARFARDVVRAARSAAQARPNPCKPAAAAVADAAADAAAAAVAVAVADAAAVAVADMDAAADAAVVAVTVVVAVTDAVAVAAAVAAARRASPEWPAAYSKYYDVYWAKHWEIRNGSSKGDELLTSVAHVAAEELEIAKAARDAQAEARA